VPPSTLDHRIKALNINKAQFKFRWSPPVSPDSPHPPDSSDSPARHRL